MKVFEDMRGAISINRHTRKRGARLGLPPCKGATTPGKAVFIMLIEKRIIAERERERVVDYRGL